MIRSSASERDGFTERAGGGGVAACCRRSSAGMREEKGRRPVADSNITTPSA